MVEPNAEEDLLTFDEALQMLGTSRPTLYRLLSSGELKGLKVGKQWRFRRFDLLNYLERGPITIAAAPDDIIDVEIAFFEAEIEKLAAVAKGGVS